MKYENVFLKIWKTVIRFHRTLLTFAICASIFLLYRIMLRTDIGSEIAVMVGTMVSAEFGALQMKMQGYSLTDAFGRMLVSDLLNIAFDLFVVTLLLTWGKTRKVVDILSDHFRAVKKEISIFWKPDRRNGSLQGINNGISDLRNRMNHYAANPAGKATKSAMFLLGVIPRVPPLPGGVAIGILIIRYNKAGLPSWIALSTGIIARHVLTLVIVYGLGSFL